MLLLDGNQTRNEDCCDVQSYDSSGGYLIYLRRSYFQYTGVRKISGIALPGSYNNEEGISFR
jgi:hypothetical protein